MSSQATFKEHVAVAVENEAAFNDFISNLDGPESLRDIEILFAKFYEADQKSTDLKEFDRLFSEVELSVREWVKGLIKKHEK